MTRRSAFFAGLSLAVCLVMSGCGSFGLGGQDDAQEATDGGVENPGDLPGFRELVDPLAEAASTKLDCASGSVEITEMAAVEITADCDQVTVDGKLTSVVGKSIGSLTIKGELTTVFVDSVNDVTIDGTKNTVIWGQGNPKVVDNGEENSATKYGI